LDGMDNVSCEVAWMGSRETHSADSWDFRYGHEQFCKCPLTSWIAVRIHVLAEELNLAVSAVGKAASFLKNRLGGSTALFAARVRNNAIRAELVAAFNDGYVAPIGIRSDCEWSVEGLVSLAIVEPGYSALPCFDLHQHL